MIPVSTSTMIPVSSPKSTATENSAPLYTFPSFFACISETVYTGLSNNRPWSELFDRSGFGKPDSVPDASQRIRKNYNYFRVNDFISPSGFGYLLSRA